MAGRGPAPAETRRRSNEPARGDWVDLAPLAAPVLDELPELAEGEWSPRARLMWSAWREDPVTAQWSPADKAFAYDTIVLYDTAPGKANELRLRMDTLGLTPKGKRDLRWRVVPGEAEAPKPKRSGRTTSGSRRARLSVVQ